MKQIIQNIKTGKTLLEDAAAPAVRPGHLLIDRNPMSTGEIGLLLRIFPQARFIVAIRHPCDVCLSCFMQNFDLNNATSCFYSLHDAAVLYDKIMRLRQQFIRVLPHPYHVIRYEDLVEDPRGETGRLLEFLGLEWDDAVLQHTRNARQRKLINTRSYDQVTEPIYKQAVYRWHRYAEQLAPVMDLLKPHIEYFGYPE